MPSNLKNLNDIQTVERLKEESFDHPVVIFKHSNRCSISSIAKSRLEHGSIDQALPFDIYEVDVIGDRAVSNYIAEVFDVYHESPQVLILSKGECIYDNSHLDITTEDLAEAVEAINS